MNGITRYDFHLDSFGDCCCDMVVKDDGQFVNYDEYADKCEEIKIRIAVANMNNRTSIEEITRLTDEVERLRADAERWQWGVKNARWICHEHEAYVAIPVALGADLSCVATRIAAVDAAIGENNGSF